MSNCETNQQSNGIPERYYNVILFCYYY